VLHTLGGTPFIYQGEEIGMTNVAFPTIDEYRDIETLNVCAEYMDAEGMSLSDVMPLVHQFSRDNARTPMQWNDDEFAGFSTVSPWIGVNPNYKDVNVERDLAGPDSVLRFYRKIIQLRRDNPVMIYGSFELVEDTPDVVFAYWRHLDSSQLLVLNNFSEEQQEVLSPSDIELGSEQLLIANYSCESADHGKPVMLRPYESRVYLLEADQ
jgi:oligo-1,6-glucosidase